MIILVKDIFNEVNFCNRKLKNRIFRSATWMAMADNGGHLNDDILDLYENLSKSEVAAIITGITSVYPDDQKIHGMMSFDDDLFIKEHQMLTGIVHENDCLIFMQIAIVDIFSMHLDKTITNLSVDEINNIIKLFVDASLRAKKAGYDGVQIHAAHFFFLSKFISPLYNKRVDEYSTSNMNASKILTDIIDGIKRVCDNEFIVMIKINATDYIPNGLKIEDTIKICKQLDKHKINAIEVSANNTSRINIKAGVNEAYFKEFAEKIKKEVSCPIILVGGHRSIESMNKILNETNIEYLSLSRPLICESNLILRWKNGNTESSKCNSCNSCYNTPKHQCIQK